MAKLQDQCGSLCSQCTTPSKQTAMVSSTFVETDIHGFKDLVQKLTGLSEGEKLPVSMPARNSKKNTKSEFKIHKRKKSQKKLEIQLGLSDSDNWLLFKGKRYVLSSPVMLSPVTPLDPNLFTCSSSHHFTGYNQSCCSSPMSCDQSPCLRMEEKEFCFGDLANTVKREPELLPLFPLHSPTQLSNN